MFEDEFSALQADMVDICTSILKGWQIKFLFMLQMKA